MSTATVAPVDFSPSLSFSLSLITMSLCFICSPLVMLLDVLLKKRCREH